jgi:hypothetical protein
MLPAMSRQLRQLQEVSEPKNSYGGLPRAYCRNADIIHANKSTPRSALRQEGTRPFGLEPLPNSLAAETRGRCRGLSFSR